MMPNSNKRIYTIDGAKFSTFQEFAQHFSETVLENWSWKGNLDAFNDILRGGFGTPEGGFILRWENSNLSRERLGYAETIVWLEERLLHCHFSNIPHFQQRLKEAQQQQGETIFDMVVQIIHQHGAGGVAEEDGVELYLL